MDFIDAITGNILAPSQAFPRIYDHNGRSEEVRAIADRLDRAMYLDNDETEAHDAADMLDLDACGLELSF